MKFAEVLSRVRLAVDDNVLSHQRTTDDALLLIAADGVREIWRLAPASRYNGLVYRTEPLSEPLAMTDDVPLGDKWIEPLFNYIASRVFGLDPGERTNTEASQRHFQRFQQNL